MQMGIEAKEGEVEEEAEFYLYRSFCSLKIDYSQVNIASMHKFFMKFQVKNIYKIFRNVSIQLTAPSSKVKI